MSIDFRLVEKMDKKSIRQMVESSPNRVLYHYVCTMAFAMDIRKSSYLISSSGYSSAISSPFHLKPRANFTDIPPETGKREISTATFLPEDMINYCLEVLVESELLKQEFPGMPHAYQIFTEREGDKVPVVVIRMWNVDKAGKKPITRYKSGNGIPIALYNK